MCTTCGCSDHADPIVTSLAPDGQAETAHQHGHEHPHPHPHEHDHHEHDHAGHEGDHAPHIHARPTPRILRVEQEVLARNSRLAERNRGWFAGRRILALNLMSSPGAGKTTLLERTIRDLGNELPISVIEGDQATPAAAAISTRRCWPRRSSGSILRWARCS